MYHCSITALFSQDFHITGITGIQMLILSWLFALYKQMVKHIKPDPVCNATCN